MPMRFPLPDVLRARLVVLALGSALLGASALAGVTSAAADPAGTAGRAATAPGEGTGTGMFAAGTQWTGEFADPSITRVGTTYYAYATATGGDNLPVAHSTDLVHWYARDAYPADSNPGWWSGYNDAMPHPARWALYDVQRNGRSFTRPWAPAAIRVGSGYVLTYSVPSTQSNPNRRCVSVATSSDPQGPFVDNTSRPLVCSSDPNGSNDPQLFQSANTTYLMWKNAGVPGKSSTKIWTRPLNAAGTAFAPGSTAHLLLATAQAWEGNVVEGPAMIVFDHHYYLFWAGNSWGTARYAIGYAICRSPVSGCVRQGTAPLIHTGGSIAGPGSPAPLIGPNGGLRLGYAAWSVGAVGYDAGGHRRLHVAALAVTGASGRLRVTALG